MYMDKGLRDDKLHNIIAHFNERKITPVKFYSIFLKEIYPFSYASSRMSNILVANYN